MTDRSKWGGLRVGSVPPSAAPHYAWPDMETEWFAVDLGDVTFLAVAFVLGVLARRAGLPPLVGYLAAGFLLAAGGARSGPLLEKLSDLGITLLLFTVGLKIQARTLVRPQVWLVSTLHMVGTIGVFALGAGALSWTGLPLFAGMDVPTALMIGFAFSFSSTVFAVKVLEASGRMSALHGQIAIGILLMQDIAAVVFLALSTRELPSVYGLAFLLLLPLRRLLTGLLDRIGHGELLVLYGFLLALGGAQLFELVQLKGDLGALVLGVVIAGHPMADELSKRMLGFKDLFLVAFFLSIGLSGGLTTTTFLLGALIAPLALVKAGAFFLLLTRFRLRIRTALLAALSLADFSEFGLIVAAIGAAHGLLPPPWLAVIAVALSLSFVLASVLDGQSHALYHRYGAWLRPLQSSDLLPDDQLLDIGSARVVLVGMGGVGTGAYDQLAPLHGDALVGIDIDPATVDAHQAAGRRVLRGDPSDADFWDRVQATHTLELVLLTLPAVRTSLAVLDRLEEVDFDGRVAAIARYPDDERRLRGCGVHTIYNIYQEAGSAFARHVARLDLDPAET